MKVKIPVNTNVTRVDVLSPMRGVKLQSNVTTTRFITAGVRIDVGVGTLDIYNGIHLSFPEKHQH